MSYPRKQFLADLVEFREEMSLCTFWDDPIRVTRMLHGLFYGYLRVDEKDLTDGIKALMEATMLEYGMRLQLVTRHGVEHVSLQNQT